MAGDGLTTEPLPAPPSAASTTPEPPEPTKPPKLPEPPEPPEAEGLALKRWISTLRLRLRGWRRWWRRLRPLGDHPAALSTWLVLRRVAVTLLGTTIVVLGLVMVVAPGPAIVVVPLGLLILGFEFAWALRLQRRIVAGATAAAGSARRRWWGLPRSRGGP